MSESKFHYLAGIVAVSRDDLETARDRVGGEEVPVDELLESTETPDTDDESFRRARAVIDNVFGFLRHDDPPAAVGTLTSDEIESSVIHIVGFANHWAAYPATRPEPVALDDLEGVPPTGTDQIVAVIDTGVVSGGPTWFSDGISPLSDFGDTTTASFGASHGTFIAGLIRRLACNHRVSMAKLPMVDNSKAVTPEGMPPLVDISTEIHLYQAVSRLIDRDEPFQALNLSVGTYTQNDLSSLIMRKTLDLWFERFPESAVFAAGGNEYEKGSAPYSPLWPAALGTDTGFAHHERVFGVGAVDRNGSDVVWDYHPSSGFTSVETLSSAASPRPWIKVRAPGTDLISLGDFSAGDGPQFVKWSGSSFATPVALATYLNVGSSPPPDTKHDEVEGLTHDVDGNIRQTHWRHGSPCASEAMSAS